MFIYNRQIRVTNIPAEAYDYIVNGKSAIEWIMERYAIKTDKDTRIVNDPNAWARKHDNPQYILTLLLSVITVSVKTRRSVPPSPRPEVRVREAVGRPRFVCVIGSTALNTILPRGDDRLPFFSKDS